MFGLGKKKSQPTHQQPTAPVATGASVANNDQGGVQQAQPIIQNRPSTPPSSKKSSKPAAAKHMEELKRGSVSIVDIIAPSSVEVDFRHIRVGDKYYRTFFVVDYPRQVSPN